MKKNCYRLLIVVMIGLIVQSCGIFSHKQVKHSEFIKPQVKDDADLLSLLVSKSITPDPVISRKIKQMLSQARSMNKDLQNIRLSMPWNPFSLIIKLENQDQELNIENPFKTNLSDLDNLNKTYEVNTIVKLMAGLYEIHFDRLYNIPLLAENYQQLDSIASAEPNRTIGDGSNILLEYKEPYWHLTFVKGWGDCPSGCIYKHRWEFDFDNNGKMTGFRETGDPLKR